MALVTGPLLFQQELPLFHSELQDPWQGHCLPGWGDKWGLLSPGCELWHAQGCICPKEGAPVWNSLKDVVWASTALSLRFIPSACPSGLAASDTFLNTFLWKNWTTLHSYPTSTFSSAYFFKGVLPPGRGKHGPWRFLWTRWSNEPRRPAGMGKEKELLMV